MIHEYKFCLWLIDTLGKQSLLLSEIQERWMRSSANDEGIPLTARSFLRYYKKACSLMYVDIECNKSTNRYELIWPEDFKGRELHNWLLSAFRVSCLAQRVNQHADVMIEPAPPAACLLQDVMDAIDRKRTLRFTYKSHYQIPHDIVFYPAFVRLFKQRWYVIGEVKGRNYTRTFALERMTGVEVLEGEKAKFSSGLKKILKPEIYFEHCFGIIRQFEPITIRYRAFWPQNAYLKDAPLHSSQVEVEHTDDYTDFEIFVRPTYDLKQELLWHRDKLAVLSPESFRQDMLSILRATFDGYETGVKHAIDE
ncbi:WYL domain-containing protein [Bacteroides helcogenes]|uniref:Transcriptional regulator n=1 Tax=Bacteroides helcogenes (strain ATCC 35417 / DSM 20613 / JCM 6297 / CCUG 15421 / P 36-108) TaxID=693979 RepID=E6SP75_BACT6|nr:WYL domain-containing protein [Bacteroides helcogenes]ADV44832.1 putative transcriptional regulator [Bacteroides helcogenes P 36-108]MDY5239690.1 WYL domain-containing protein [Bacteroides helcogenes]